MSRSFGRSRNIGIGGILQRGRTRLLRSASRRRGPAPVDWQFAQRCVVAPETFVRGVWPMEFRVDLNIFRGPLDLLLYLVRKHEVDIVDIPVAEITDQFLEYLTVLEQLDVAAVSDFLAVASTLIEIKSQQVLPRSDEVEDEVDDPREELVRRLLQYKEYRDAASVLEERSRQWQQHYARQEDDLPPRERNLAEEPIHEVELWDLVNAFGRIVRDTKAAKPSSIVYDDTPIHVYMARIHTRLLEEGRLAFSALFSAEIRTQRWLTHTCEGNHIGGLGNSICNRFNLAFYLPCLHIHLSIYCFVRRPTELAVHAVERAGLLLRA